MIEASSTEKLTFKSTPKAASVAHAWLTSAVYLELQSEAQRRRVHPDVLTAQILERVITSALVDRILDL